MKHNQHKLHIMADIIKFIRSDPSHFRPVHSLRTQSCLIFDQIMLFNYVYGKGIAFDVQFCVSLQQQLYRKEQCCLCLSHHVDDYFFIFSFHCCNSTLCCVLTTCECNRVSKHDIDRIYAVRSVS